MRILVTGASGFLGSAISADWERRGHDVVRVARRADTPGKAGMVAASLGEPLPGDLSGIDLAVHGAHDFRPEQSRVVVDGTMLWFDQLQAAGARAQVLLSSLSAHRTSRSVYGQTKAAIEAAMQASGGAVLRLGLVAGRGGMFGSIADHAAKPWGWLVPAGGAAVWCTGLSDILALLPRIDLFKPGSSLNAFAPAPTTLASLVHALRQERGLTAKAVSVPASMTILALTAGGRFNPRLAMLAESLEALRQTADFGWRSDFAALGMRQAGTADFVREATAGRDY